MHCGRRRPQQSHDRVGLAADRPHLGQAGDRRVHIEELGDSACGRGVENDGVVGVRRFLILRRTASYTLPVSSTSRSPGAIEVAKS